MDYQLRPCFDRNVANSMSWCSEAGQGGNLLVGRAEGSDAILMHMTLLWTLQLPPTEAAEGNPPGAGEPVRLLIEEYAC